MAFKLDKENALRVVSDSLRSMQGRMGYTGYCDFSDATVSRVMSRLNGENVVHTFATDSCNYIVVMGFHTLLLDDVRVICPMIELAVRRMNAPRTDRLGLNVGELREVVPVIDGRRRVYCVPATPVLRRMYRQIGFVAAAGVLDAASEPSSLMVYDFEG